MREVILGLCVAAGLNHVVHVARVEERIRCVRLRLYNFNEKSLLQPTSLQLRSTDQVRPDTNSAW